MNFNLKDAAPDNSTTQVQYQRPGVYDNVVISKVNSGQASTGSKYLQFETVGGNGEVGKSPQMYLNNEPKPDGKPTAWSITARNLRSYIMNTHNVSLEDAESMIQGIESVEQLEKKVSALLVGKKFRAKFIGVETSKGAIIAELAGSESMKVDKENTKLRYDEVRDTRKYKGTVQPASSEATFKASNTGDDLPF